MPQVWTDDEGEQMEVRDVDPAVPLAIITVLSTMAAIVAIWMCLK